MISNLNNINKTSPPTRCQRQFFGTLHLRIKKYWKHNDAEWYSVKVIIWRGQSFAFHAEDLNWSFEGLHVKELNCVLCGLKNPPLNMQYTSTNLTTTTTTATYHTEVHYASSQLPPFIDNLAQICCGIFLSSSVPLIRNHNNIIYQFSNSHHTTPFQSSLNQKWNFQLKKATTTFVKWFVKHSEWWPYDLGYPVRVQSEFGSVGSVDRGKPETQIKTLTARMRTNNKLNPHN